MNKKYRIILIISSIAIIAALVVIGLLLFHPSPAPGTKPGDPITLNQTPNYKACSIISTDTIKTAFGKDLGNLSDGKRAGIIGLNGKPAEECNYTMTIKGKSNDTLSIQVYDYSTQTPGTQASSEAPDQAWSNISNVKYPHSYLPTYYKKGDTTDGKSTAFYLRVINGPKNYLFTITQPKSNVTYQNTDALPVLEQLAIGANYGVTDTNNAPPAPKVSE